MAACAASFPAQPALPADPAASAAGRLAGWLAGRPRSPLAGRCPASARPGWVPRHTHPDRGVRQLEALAEEHVLDWGALRVGVDAGETGDR